MISSHQAASSTFNVSHTRPIAHSCRCVCVQDLCLNDAKCACAYDEPTSSGVLIITTTWKCHLSTAATLTIDDTCSGSCYVSTAYLKLPKARDPVKVMLPESGLASHSCYDDSYSGGSATQLASKAGIQGKDCADFCLSVSDCTCAYATSSGLQKKCVATNGRTMRSASGNTAWMKEFV